MFLSSTETILFSQTNISYCAKVHTFYQHSSITYTELQKRITFSSERGILWKLNHSSSFQVQYNVKGF